MKLTFETKGEQIYAYVKDKILSGEMARGENIVIKDIAQSLGVSTIPVREALKQLASDGLVEFIPYKGALVANFDEDKIGNVMTTRAVLEAYAFVTAIPHIDGRRYDRLQQMYERMEELIRIDDRKSFSTANKEFHRELYRSCPYTLMVEMIFDLWDRENWAKSIFLYYKEEMRVSNDEHKEILERIKNKRIEGAEEMLRQHHLRTIPYYVEILKNDPSPQTAK